MVHVSVESAERTRERLLGVMDAARLRVFDGAYVFEEWPVDGAAPELDGGTLAVVRDERVWSRLVPAPPDWEGPRYGLIRFHFPPGQDNSGFVGWLASHLKRTLGTGVFVVCGQNSGDGGIFDYTGFPIELREAVLREVARLREAGAALGRQASLRRL